MANVIIKDSWRAIIKLLPTDIKVELYEAICAYQLGESFELSDDAKAVFDTFRKDMDLSKARSGAGTKGMSSRWGSDNSVNNRVNNSVNNKKGKKDGFVNNKVIDSAASLTDTTSIHTVVDNNKKDNTVIEHSTAIRIEEGKREIREKKEENSAEIAVVAEVENAVVGSEDFAKFQMWIRGNAPRVAKMKRPFKESEFRTLQSKYSAGEVAEVLKAMDNYRPLIEKNMSAYLTASRWLEDNRKRKAGEKVKEQSNFEKVAGVVAEVNRRQDERAAAGIKRFTMYGDD